MKYTHDDLTYIVTKTSPTTYSVIVNGQIISTINKRNSKHMSCILKINEYLGIHRIDSSIKSLIWHLNYDYRRYLDDTPKPIIKIGNQFLELIAEKYESEINKYVRFYEYKNRFFVEVYESKQDAENHKRFQRQFETSKLKDAKDFYDNVLKEKSILSRLTRKD